jgi:hypothetical protein
LEPDKVRDTFKMIYDLDIPVSARYNGFRLIMNSILSDIPTVKNHYQDHRAFSVYLALRYPEIAYLYKFGMFSSTAQLFDFPHKAKKGAISNIEKFYSLCEWIKPFLLKDDTLLRLHHGRLDKDLYQDPAYNLLTQDFIYACVNYDVIHVTEEKTVNVVPTVQIEELDMGDFESISPGVTFRGRQNVDYSSRNERNQKIGEAAELFVLQYEKVKLRNSNKWKKIVHTSIEYGDGIGYDIESFDQNGQKIFIEVKATTGSFKTPFYITRNEMYCSIQNPKKYRLYRVYNFNATAQTGSVKIFKGSLEPICNEPLNYMINLKEKKT